ncbi:predicted protein, partial [Phaeodactylum tricornutum CCAP 1055/1]
MSVEILSHYRLQFAHRKQVVPNKKKPFSEEQAVIDPIEGQRAEDNREAENASFLKNLTFRASQASKREENSNWDNIVPVAPLLKTGFSSHLLHGSTSSQPTDDAIDQLGSSKARSQLVVGDLTDQRGRVTMPPTGMYPQNPPPKSPSKKTNEVVRVVRIFSVHNKTLSFLETMRYRPSLYTFFLGTALQILSASAFNAPLTIQTSVSIRLTVKRGIFSRAVPKIKAGNQDELMKEESVRLQVWKSRRNQIRQTLKSADQVRIFRLQQGWVPELGDDGKPLKSDGKVALTLTAFVIAAGAIALRIGGRAALVSTLGLDFVTENPELKANLDIVLNTADNMDPVTKLLLFTASWTAVKVLCFDAAGVALALSSGILFGGVLQGAVVSAAAATFGSTVAFGLAKLDTPLRKKGLGLLDEYPSLRGIEKVVAKEGFKAILTLRLAPLLPIPIGAYNYIYSITNVPLLDFCGGIFIGSLKPYLLDSYLGYFGKSLVDGTADQNGWQDTLLLAALGFSVLIGVFASQLASETWDSVLEE